MTTRGEVAANLKAWDDGHGGSRAGFADASWIYYENGDMMENLPFGTMFTPSDPHVRACNIVRYYELDLRVREAEFGTLKSMIVNASQSWERREAVLRSRVGRNDIIARESELSLQREGHQYETEQAARLTRLKQLQGQVQALQKKLTAAREKADSLDLTKPKPLTEEDKAVIAEAAARKSKLQQMLKELEI